MVPVLNSLGTDVACVGVRGFVQVFSPLERMTADIACNCRTTTLISASSNFVTSLAFADSHGCWQMLLIRL
jgi:hypothetical protein